MARHAILSIVLLVLGANAQTVRYVSLDGGNELPYTDWTMAAHRIQDALDLCSINDVVLVSNGVYNLGGRAVMSLTNRVVLTNRATLQGLNGPSVTIIEGSGGALSSNAVRGVFISDGAVLSGFTVRNGRTMSIDSFDGGGGGIFSWGGGIVTNCIISGNIASSNGGGGAMFGTYNNCIFSNNSALRAGGGCRKVTAYDCVITHNSSAGISGGGDAVTLYNCVVEKNRANYGGGVGLHLDSNNKIYNSRISENIASNTGGGVYKSSYVYDSVIISNRALSGAGGAAGTSMGGSTPYFYRCRIADNVASNSGGGLVGVSANAAYAYNCVIERNRARTAGGGISGNVYLYGSKLLNNWAGYGGGASGGRLYSCVLAGNTATNTATYGGGGTYGSTAYCCTVVGNWSSNQGGGMFLGVAYNSIIVSNRAAVSSNNIYGLSTNSAFNCSVPLSPGTGNTTSDPQFIKSGSGFGTNHLMGDYRLRHTSPLVRYAANAGSYSFTSSDARSRDIRGAPRVWPLYGTNMSLGAYQHTPVDDPNFLFEATTWRP